MKPIMRSFALFCLLLNALLLFNVNAQLNFLQKHEASVINQNVSSDKNDIISSSAVSNTIQLEPLSLEDASRIPNQEALQSILQMKTLVLYKIKANPNSNINNEISSSNELKDAIARNKNENIVLVWEDTVPFNTIMLLDVLSDIQFDSKNSFSYTHKCYKKEIGFWSSGITCVFVIKPMMNFKSFGGRMLQEDNTTLSSENTTESNNTVTESPPVSNTTTPKYNFTVITANNTTSGPKNNNTSNSTNTTTVKPTKPKDASGPKNKPIKTDVASVHPRSLFNSIILLLAGGLVIAAIVVACIKIKQKWRKQKFLTIPNKKIDLQKLIIKPSFFSQPESAMASVNSGVLSLKPKRSLFLSDTNNFAMSPVIDVKTIQHLNLEENHRSSMLPEEVILTNIDDGPESLDSSKTSDASPQDIGFNIEFSMLDAQESSKFRGKNLKSEV